MVKSPSLSGNITRRIILFYGRCLVLESNCGWGHLLFRDEYISQIFPIPRIGYLSGLVNFYCDERVKCLERQSGEINILGTPLEVMAFQTSIWFFGVVPAHGVFVGTCMCPVA